MTNEDAMYRPRYLSLYKIVGFKAFAYEGYAGIYIAAKKQILFRKTRKKKIKNLRNLFCKSPLKVCKKCDGQTRPRPGGSEHHLRKRIPF